MAEAKLLVCEGCGAPLPAPKGRTTLTCTYCRRELSIVSGATRVTAQLEARPITDRLLQGYTGEDLGQARRHSVAEMASRDWPSAERGLWPTAARASTSFGAGWGAGALVGPPRVYPSHGDIPGAWAPSNRHSEVEWVELDYRPDAPPARAIRVFETNLPGASFAVTRIDGDGEELLWQRRPSLTGSEAAVLEIELDPPRRVERLRVYVNNSLGSSWSELDTVGLVAADPLPVAMRTAPRRFPRVRRHAGCLVALGFVAVLATVAFAVAAGSGERAAPVPVPPRAGEAVGGTSLMVWNAGRERLASSGVVWASELVAFSSQYQETTSAARRVLGPPDVFPAYGDEAGGWAPLGRDDGPEFVDLRFGAAVRASAVVIVETYHPGALARVEDVTPGRPPAILWEGVTEAPELARILSVELSEPREISAVRVVLDTARASGWNEIDAVGLYPAR